MAGGAGLTVGVAGGAPTRQASDAEIKRRPQKA
jgi:hypothetical protein